MADVPNTGLNIVQDDLTAVTPNSNAFLDTGVLNVQSGAFLTNDVDATDADPTDGDATDYRNAVVVADALTTVASGGNTLATLQEEKLDLRDFTLNLVGTGSNSTNSSPLAATIRLADGDVVFTGDNLIDFGGHTGGTNLNGGNTEAQYDVTARTINVYDNVRFLNHVTTTVAADQPRMSFRGAHPTRSSFTRLFFDDGMNLLFNSGITQHGASLGGTVLALTLTDGPAVGATADTDWTPWTSMDTSALTGAGHIGINGGCRLVLIAPMLNSNALSVRGNNGQNSVIEFHTPWQPSFTREDTGGAIPASVSFDDSLTIRASQTAADYTFGGYPAATTTDGNLGAVTNGQLYLILEGTHDVTGVTPTSRAYSANERGFRHYSYVANLDSQDLTIGSYTTTARSGAEITRFGSEMNGFLSANDSVYALIVDALADEASLATAIATTFVVDNTDKLYQAVKARYVTDQTDVDWSDIANTPTGSSIDLGDDDITWVDGTTEAVAIDGTSHSITITTNTIGSLSNGAFTNEIVTTGTVALTGTALTNVDIDAGSITGYGDLVNSDLTSDSAIALSGTVDYGGATLTSTFSTGQNFSTVPTSLSDVTLIGSNVTIAFVNGGAAREFTNVTWNGRVNFGDTSTGVVHVFNNTVFTESPFNSAGNGVDFQLGPNDTIAETFNGNGIPAGFNQIPVPGILNIEVQPINVPSTVAVFTHSAGEYTQVGTTESLAANAALSFTPTETTGDYRVLMIPQSTVHYPVIRDFNFDGVSDTTITVTQIPIVDEVLSTVNDDGSANTEGDVPSSITTSSSLLQRPLGAETDLGTVSGGTALTAANEYRFSLASHTLTVGDFVTFSNLTGFIGARTFEVIEINGLAIDVAGIPSPLPVNGTDTALSVALVDGRLKYNTNGATGTDSLTNLQTQTHLRGILADPNLATVLIANVGDIAHNAAANASTRIDAVIANSKISVIANSDYIQLSSITTSEVVTQQMTGGAISSEAIDGLSLIDINSTVAGAVTIVTPLVQFNPNPAGITISEVVTGVVTSPLGERTEFLVDGRKVGPYWSPTENEYTGN